MTIAVTTTLRPRDLLLGLLVTLVWGANFSVIGYGLQQVEPFLLTALRFTFAALPLIFFVPRPRGVPLWGLAVYGLIFGVGMWWVVTLALQHGVSPGIASLLLQFGAFFTVLGSVFVLGERVRRQQALGMLVAALGLVGLILASPGRADLGGVGLMLLAALAWACCNLMVKHWRPAQLLSFVVWTSAFAVPALLLLGWVQQGEQLLQPLRDGLSGAAWVSVLFQGWISTVLCYIAWNALIKRYPATSVAPLSLLVPVSGMLTAWLAFDARLLPLQWAAVAVTLLGLGVFLLPGVQGRGART